MRIFNHSTLIKFWTKHPDAAPWLQTWFAMVNKAEWKGTMDIKAVYPAADFLANDRVVFDVKGNKYRLVAHVRYAPIRCVYIRFIGTHAEYDKIDATKI